MVKHRVIVVIICLALMIPSIFGMAATRVKYDLLYYLPEDLDTIKGLLDVGICFLIYKPLSPLLHK